MRILIIRHADPYYPTDSLTERGFLEAELLGERLKEENISEFYVSPLGRAKKTCDATIKHYPNKVAKECKWLTEFGHQVNAPGYDGKHITWDLYPAVWSQDERLYDRNQWYEVDWIKEGNIKEYYDEVVKGLDDLLKEHGYIHKKGYFAVEESNEKTIALFCHFGVEAYILSYFLELSPIAIVNQTFCAPSSVTTLITEERRKGEANFRINAIGDTSHLFKAGLQPSFSGRFCEIFDSKDRH